MRYGMDCKVTMSLSFNPENMVCDGCKKRGKHSLVGKDPLVATDQNSGDSLQCRQQAVLCIG